MYPVSTVKRESLEGNITEYGFELISKRPTYNELKEWGISLPRGNDYTLEELYLHALSCVKKSWAFDDEDWPVKIAQMWMAVVMYESGDRANDYFPRQFFTDIEVVYDGMKRHYNIVPLFARHVYQGASYPNLMSAGCLAYGIGNISAYTSIMADKKMARRAAWDWKYNVELSVRILSRKWYVADAHERGMLLDAAVIYYHGWDGTASETTEEYLSREELDGGGKEKRSSKRYYDNVLKLLKEYLMELEIKQCIFTENKCYTEPETMTPIGIMVHDTGAGNPYLKRYLAPDDGIIGENEYHNHWNQYLESNNKCVHAFIGKGVDDKVYTYQTLEWTLKAHHSGRHPVTHKRAWDMGYIGFEMLDDKYVHENYFLEVYGKAVELCVFLCKKYGLKSTDIISHKEGHEMGIASNHGDPHEWFAKFGKSMDTLRQEVAERLGETMPTEENINGAKYKVLADSLNFREEPNTSCLVIDTLHEGEMITATGKTDGKWIEALNADWMKGWASRGSKGQYLELVELPPVEEPTEQPDPEEPAEAVDKEWLAGKVYAARSILDEIAAKYDL